MTRIETKPPPTTPAASFNPNRMTFKQGVDRLQEVLKKYNLSLKTAILTSRDERVVEATHALRVTNIPSRFEKWQLPIMLEEPSQMYLTVAQANAEVPSHSHDQGSGVRFIVSGSILHNGMELTAGDWMFIPKGVPYSFQVGPHGAVMCYCYSCCCA